MGTNWSEFANNKAVKIVAFTLLGLICLITFTGIFTNKPIKIWFVEFNRRDTAFKYVNTILYDTVTKTDTLKIVSYLTNGWEKKVGKKADDTSKKVGKYSIQGPFNAPTQIGDNNTQNNNNGIKQRTLTNELSRDILYKLKDTSSEIEYRIPPNDKEAETYADQIATYLFNRGFRKYHVIHYMGPPHYDVVYYDYKMLNTNGKDSTFVISVYPSSNTSK